MKAFMGDLRCGGCNQVMELSITDKCGLNISCPSDFCDNYMVKYEIPSIELKRVDE